MTTTEFILRLILDLIYFEVSWFFVKRGLFKLSSLRMILKLIMAIGILGTLSGAVESIFNLYFTTLWYFVIYPDRIINELTEEQVTTT